LGFRESFEGFVTEKGRESFKSSDSGESPARSTLALVFDSGVSFSSPVDGGRGGGGIEGFFVFVGSFLG